MDRKDLKLTKAEKKAAKKSYEDEKRASVPYQRPSYAHYYPANEQSLSNIRNWRPTPRMDEKPIASVRPVQSTPIPMMPRQAVVGGHASGPAFPVNYLQKAGVLVQRVITTTDIVIPGTNSSTDVQARISAGESIHVIKGSKGTYIRTNDGRIFAIRSGKPRASDGAAPATREVGGSLLRSVSNGRASPPELKRFSPDGVRHVSPSSSPNLLHQIHHYTPGPTNDLTPRPAQHGLASEPQRSDVIGSGSALDIHSLKRKLLSDSRGSKRSTSTTAAANFPAFPVSGGYNMGSMGFPPALLGALGHMTPSLVGGTNRGQFLNDLHSMLPTNALSSTHSSSSSTTIASSSSSLSSSSSTSSSSSSSIPPFLFNPSMANMLSGFSMPFTSPLLPDSSRMFSNSLSSSGSTPVAPSSFLSPSSLLGAALSRPDTRHTLAENGGSSSDDDVIEVMGQ
ncbi:helicase ARIP4 [Tachysurus ichikawai]